MRSWTARPSLLWHQPIKGDGSPDSLPRAVTVGIGMQRAAFSKDGGKLAYSKGRRVGNLYRIPVLEGRLAIWSDAEQLTFDQAGVRTTTSGGFPPTEASRNRSQISRVNAAVWAVPPWRLAETGFISPGKKISGTSG